MNDIAEDVKDLLEAESSLGLTFNENLFIGWEPPEPDDCVTIFSIPGGKPEQTLGNDSNYYRPSINIRVRSTGYSVGSALIQNIVSALKGRHNELAQDSSSLITAIICQGDPSLLDWPQPGIARFIVNFNIQRRE